MTLANVALTHTFDTWRVRTNETLTVVNGLQNGSGFANVASLKIQGIGATGQFLKIANSATGLIASGDGAADFSDLTGTIAGSQFPPSITIAANTTFSGATKTLGSIGSVKISGGSANNMIVTDGSGNLSFAAQTPQGSIWYRDVFSPSGSTATFALSGNPPSSTHVFPVISGVSQLSGSWSISGNSLTFTSNPPAGTNTLEVVWFSGTEQSFSGNYHVQAFTNGVGFTSGVSTTLTLDNTPGAAAAVEVIKDGAVVHHSAWTLLGNVISFGSAITGTNVEVRTCSTAPLNIPADTSVTWAKLASSGVYSTDGTLATNSNALVPTQKAVKTYVDTSVSNAPFVATGSVSNLTKATTCSNNILIDGATITPDLSGPPEGFVILGGNRTLGIPSNLAAGKRQGFIWDIWQDGTGTRTLAYNWIYRTAGGTALVLSTVAGTRDKLSGDVAYYTSGTATITIATPGVITLTSHGLTAGGFYTGQFTTTGALPTGLVANTTYWFTVVTANTLKASTTLANAAAGTYITTSGSQSGVHTLVIGAIDLVLQKAFS